MAVGGAAISCGRPSPRCATLRNVLRTYLPRKNHAGGCVAKGMSVKSRSDTSEHEQRVSARVIPQYQLHQFIFNSVARTRTGAELKASINIQQSRRTHTRIFWCGGLRFRPWMRSYRTSGHLDSAMTWQQTLECLDVSS